MIVKFIGKNNAARAVRRGFPRKNVESWVEAPGKAGIREAGAGER